MLYPAELRAPRPGSDDSRRISPRAYLSKLIAA
jgi:hypothetical protein